MNRTVAILNQKGGVGKTTVTLGLASAAAHAGRRILVVDLDPQASSTWVLGVDPDPDRATIAAVMRSRNRDPNTAIVPSAWNELPGIARVGGVVEVLPGGIDSQALEAASTSKLRGVLDSVEDDYDAILIDCPPSLGSLSRDALTAARHVVIVVEPSTLGLRGIGGVADLIEDVWETSNPDLELTGVIVNRVPAVSAEADRRLDELVRIVGRQAIWSPMIPQRVILNQVVGDRQPIHTYGSRASDAIVAFDALWRKLRTALRRSA